VITAGQRGDSPQFQAVLEAISVPRPGPGRARTRPDRVLADKAYGSRANCACLRRRGIAARCISSATNRHPVLPSTANVTSSRPANRSSQARSVSRQAGGDPAPPHLPGDGVHVRPVRRLAFG
jgi:hypothetical protein